MKTILFAIAVLLLTSSLSFAEPYTPGPLELAPLEKIKCPWSKLNSQQYKECLKRKKYFNSMSEEDKKKFNDEVKKRRLQEQVDTIDRRTR
jgi:hypothetical protein